MIKELKYNHILLQSNVYLSKLKNYKKTYSSSEIPYRVYRHAATNNNSNYTLIVINMREIIRQSLNFSWKPYAEKIVRPFYYILPVYLVVLIFGLFLIKIKNTKNQ
eukprot:GHVR01035085.1.p2 GENE.GHVR01035085.1~~GHVR01035085.1.p2  ORF type:complete len:106 (+),score=1.31 GHVR01035085.1:1943-2260(+)